MKQLVRSYSLPILTVFALAAISLNALASGSGMTGVTNKSGGAGCSCHNAGGVTVTISGPTSLTVNQTGTYTVTLSGSTNTGIDIAASNGTLAAVSTGLQLLNGEITHTSARSTNTFTFTYTPTSSGAKTLYATGVLNGFKGSWAHATNYSVNASPLPVQISSFQGTVQASQEISLNWTTLSEINNYGFRIQRRAETDPQFTELTGVFIPGHGTTSLEQQYSYTDKSAGKGKWYYRLNQIDLDGTSHLTDAVMVSITTGVEETGKPNTFALSQNYPNPFNPSTTITYSLASATRAELEVFALTGQKVATLVSEDQQAGTHQVEFQGANLASGVYLYRLRAGSFSETKKFILAK